MIIFGTRGVPSTISKGQFNCPQCEVGRPYKLKKSTRYFTLYFIPIIPLGRLGEYVECGACKGTFIPNVLKRQKEQERDVISEYEKAMRHSLIKMMLADGHVDDNEKEVIVDVVNKMSHNDITISDVHDMIAEVESSDQTLEHYLKSVSPLINTHGKELIIKAAFAVAAADGNVDSAEAKLLKEMANNLEITNAHFNGIMQEVRDKANERARQN